MIAVATRCSAVGAGGASAGLWEGRAAEAGNRSTCNLFKVARGGRGGQARSASRCLRPPVRLSAFVGCCLVPARVLGPSAAVAMAGRGK